MKRLFTLLLLTAVPLAQAADSYGYLAFWQNPDKPEIVTVTKTTQEDADEAAAAAELQAFCREQDKTLDSHGKAFTGCLSVTPLKNTCVAAAWPRTQGLLKENNVVVAQSRKFKKVAQQALDACEQQYGKAAACEVETVFCTSAGLYQQSGKWTSFWKK